MNRRKSKMIRRLAEQMTTGLPDTQYTDVALNPKKPTRRTRQLYNCTRLVYQRLKKNYKDKAA